MARRIVKIDALFELALGVVLIVGAAGGLLDGTDYPSRLDVGCSPHSEPRCFL